MFCEWNCSCNIWREATLHIVECDFRVPSYITIKSSNHHHRHQKERWTVKCFMVSFSSRTCPVCLASGESARGRRTGQVRESPSRDGSWREVGRRISNRDSVFCGFPTVQLPATESVFGDQSSEALCNFLCTCSHWDHLRCCSTAIPLCALLPYSFWTRWVTVLCGSWRNSGGEKSLGIRKDGTSGICVCVIVNKREKCIWIYYFFFFWKIWGVRNILFMANLCPFLVNSSCHFRQSFSFYTLPFGLC